VPVPRRFDRQPPERDTTRINERIRVPEVRLIDDKGEQVGIMKTSEALARAQERELDLVEVAPDARPPVCRILDYSKYKYEQAQKVKAAKKHQQQIVVREIKLRPKIAQHDYDTKKGHVIRFLNHKDKVKVTIMFRGREMAHPERGEMLLNRLIEDLGEMAVVDQRPQQDGRNMTMLLSPSKVILAGGRGSKDGTVEEASEVAEEAAAEAPVAAPEPKQRAGKAAQAAKVAEEKEAAADEPEAETPEAETPEAETPEAETPEAETPEAEAPQADVPEAEAPKAEPEAPAKEPAAPRKKRAAAKSAAE
jgi:translation initiation factor IF-3